MDERSDYVQRFREEWGLQNRLYKICMKHRALASGFLFSSEEQGGQHDLQGLPNHCQEASHTDG